MSMSIRQEGEKESNFMSTIAENKSSSRKSYLPFAKLRSRRRNSTVSGPPKQRTKSINVVMT